MPYYRCKIARLILKQHIKLVLISGFLPCYGWIYNSRITLNKHIKHVAISRLLPYYRYTIARLTARILCFIWPGLGQCAGAGHIQAAGIIPPLFLLYYTCTALLLLSDKNLGRSSSQQTFGSGSNTLS